MLPSVLKDMILYNDAQAYIGKAKTVTLPNLSRKMEAWRAAGMHRAVKIDMGAEDDLAIEHSYGGPERQIFEQYGLLGVSAVGLRFVGAYQNDETGAYDTYEIVARGRHSEIAMGDQTPGEMGEFKVTTDCAYYKLIHNGRTLIEDDPLNMLLIVNGVDLYTGRRAALGL
ncbi:MAG TPA: phage major tail tube protein [Sphingobium sp.]|nr:phage major tail tube protein [Sphingobium sp.]